MTATTDEVVLGPREAVEFYLPIMGEYAGKLGDILREAAGLNHDVVMNYGPLTNRIVEAARLCELCECMMPSIERLLRRTSTLLEHAEISEDLGLVLALRQEELEAQFRFAPMILNDLENNFGKKNIQAVIDRTRVTALRG